MTDSDLDTDVSDERIDGRKSEVTSMFLVESCNFQLELDHKSSTVGCRDWRRRPSHLSSLKISEDLVKYDFNSWV